MPDYSEIPPVPAPEEIMEEQVPQPESGETDGGVARDLRVVGDHELHQTSAVRPVSASLLREIAEAADGTRGVSLYCTATYAMDLKFDHRAETHATLAEAADRQAKLAQEGIQVEIFGPFKTEPRSGPELGTSPIATIVITLHDNRTISVDPKKFDALFWTVSAVEKFVAPYYASKAGLERATLVRTMFDKVGMVCLKHGPNTEPLVEDFNSAKPQTVEALREGGRKIGVTFVSM